VNTVKQNIIALILGIGICLLVGVYALPGQTVEASPSVSMSLFGDQRFTNDDASYLYTKSMGGGIEFAVDTSNLRLLANLQAHAAESNNVWTDMYTILSASGGLGYTFFNSRGHQLTATCKYGVIAHFTGNSWYLNQKGEAGLRLSNQMSPHMAPFVEATVALMLSAPENTILYNGSAGIQYTF